VGFRSATLRAAERWRSVKVTEFERRQMAAARNEPMMAGRWKRGTVRPVGTMIWTSRAALGADGRNGTDRVIHRRDDESHRAGQ
jgi:hypothetical protein